MPVHSSETPKVEVFANAHAIADPLTLRVYESLNDLQELEPLWNNLVSKCPSASIFNTWEWLTSWWRSFGHDRSLLVLALFDSTSQLLGLAPLSICTERYRGLMPVRVLCLMGDGSADSDNLDFQALPGTENLLTQKVLEYLKNGRNRWDLAQFNTMSSDSLAARFLSNSLKESSWSCFEYSRSRSTIFLPPRWDEYLDRLSPKSRKNLGYYGRRLQKKYSVRIYRCSREEELSLCLDELFRLHQLHWQSIGEAGTFSDMARREFYADLSRRLLAKNELELWVAELDGRIAAAQFAMRYRDKVYTLQEGYDPDYALDTVGFVLRGEVLKRLISEGVRVYDFLGGEDRHKARWGAQTGAYRDIHFAPRYSKGGLLLTCAHGMLSSKEWLRGRLRPSAWELLHRANLVLRRVRDVAH